jgi:hypothetical protein
MKAAHFTAPNFAIHAAAAAAAAAAVQISPTTHNRIINCATFPGFPGCPAT